MDEVFIILSYGRIAERLLITLTAAFALAMGWHLFNTGVFVEQSASGEFKSIKVSLTKVSPGIFFALFGCIVLGIGLYRPLNLEDATDVVGPERSGVRSVYLGDSSGVKPSDVIKTANAVAALARDSSATDSTRAAHQVLQKMKATAEVSLFSTSELTLYKAKREQFNENPASLTAEERQILEKVAPVLDAEFSDGGSQ